MPDLNDAAEVSKYRDELLQGSEDPDELEGMPRFMALILDKSRKLAVPGLILTGAIAATVGAVVATGGGLGAAAAAVGICNGSVKLLQTMRGIYKRNNKSKKKTEKNDVLLNSAVGEMSEEISGNLLDMHIQSNLEDMNLSLEQIKEGVYKIQHHQIHCHDKNIEAAFQDVNAKIKRTSYDSALEVLNGLNFVEMKLHSNTGVEKARDRIIEAMKDGKKEAMQMYTYLLGVRQKLEALIQMKYFLKDMKNLNTTEMERYLKNLGTDFIQDLEGYWDIMKYVFQDKYELPTVIVLGKCGTGKSTLCNILAGLPKVADEEIDGFATSPDTDACTQATKIKEFCYFGDPHRPVRIIDTPGFDDPTKNHDAVIISDFVEVLKNEVRGINLIVLALNGQSPRLEGSLLAMIKIIRGMFTPAVWDNMAVVFTRVPMDKRSIKRRSNNDPEHDAKRGEGFVKTLVENFKPPETGKTLEYLYMDAYYEKDDEEEEKALEESREKLWKMISANKSFSTNMVEEVLTEYASLQQDLKQKEVRIEGMENQLREYEENENKRIQKENEETRTPVEGFTFSKIRDGNKVEKEVKGYSEYITKLCTETLKPFESAESFSNTINTIENDRDRGVMFVASQSDLFSSEKLLNRIPGKHPQILANKKFTASQLVFILEISNFTNHFLNDLDIHMESGNNQPLFVWRTDHPDGDKTSLTQPTLLDQDEHGRYTFVIPPFAKERLIFRNSGQLHKTRLKGILTMNIKQLKDKHRTEKKMMVGFKIDGGTVLSSDTSFCVGFPDTSNSPMEIQELVKKGKGNFYAHNRFSKHEDKKKFILSRTFNYPTNQVAGDFNLSCCFGNASRCRGIAILSKTPEKNTSSTC